MRYEQIDNSLFKDNRAKLAEHLKPNSIVVIHSHDIYPVNADGEVPFQQHADLLYLTGADQEESVLILYPDAANKKNREILFVRETNDHIAIWEGEKLTKESATEVSGIEQIQWSSQFETVFRQLAVEADNIYLSTNDHPRLNNPVETKNDRFIKQCKKSLPLHNFERLSPIMHLLRSHKHPVEINIMQKACDITEKGFRRVLGFIKPGVGEWEIEAELIHEFTKNKSKGFAYTPIIASGKNACVLHYIDNSCEVKDGEIILMDTAAEYANWNSDMTRSVPANGKFTDRQRAVYDAVLRTLRYANTILRPGLLPNDYQAKVREFMETELIQLGLIDAEEAKKQDTSKPLVSKYFMHGTSHHIGIAVHDVSVQNTPFAVGQVLTIEPGIYIRDEDLGIRLENCVVIGENENIDLMESIPIEADEIEALMAK